MNPLEKASTMMSDKGYQVGSLEDIPQRDGYRMNEELIQRLVDQCVVKRERHGTTVDVLQSRPFAELIVRECIKVCEQVISDPVPKSVDTWLNGGSQCINEIKQHFGIE